MPVSEAPEYPDWRREAERQTTMGKDILSDTETYGAHLANITRGELRMDWALSQLREAVREVLEQWETLKRDWNRQVEQAGREGVHVIYTDRYNRLHEQMDTLSKNMLLDYDIGSQMRAVLSRLDEAVSDRRYAGTWRNLMAGQLDHREALEAEEARRGVAVPDHRDYDTWRNVTDKAADHCAELLARRERYGIHLDDIARRGESLPSASRACARRCATTTGTSRRHWYNSARARTSACARSASPVSSTIPRSFGICGRSARSKRPASGSARVGT